MNESKDVVRREAKSDMKDLIKLETVQDKIVQLRARA